MFKKHKQSGFTLVELMVTIVIATILVSLAYPSYRKYVIAGRMENARETMMDNINRMETFYGNYRTFLCGSVGAPECAGKGPNETISATDSSNGTGHTGYYQVAIKPSLPTHNTGGDAYWVYAEPSNSMNSGSFSDSELASQEIYLVYFSGTGSFSKCTRAGLADAIDENSTKTSIECTPW